MQLITALSEENFGCWVRNDGRPEPSVERPHSRLEFHVIGQYDMSHHSLQLVRSKEPSWAGRRVSIRVSFNTRDTETSDTPSMPPMAEGDVIERRVDELVLRPFALALAHLREAERVKRVCVCVLRLVVVYGVRGRDEKGALWKECAVKQSYVLQHLACERY